MQADCIEWGVGYRPLGRKSQHRLEIQPMGDAKVMLCLMASFQENAGTVTVFFQDLRERGLGDPLLVDSDGAAGIIKAIETCYPRLARHHGLPHRMRKPGGQCAGSPLA